MFPLPALVLACAVSPFPGVAVPAVEPSAFRAWFDEAARGRLRVPATTRRRAAGFRYVFVGGLGGERMPGYFDQNAKALRALGVPRRAIHVVQPSSRRTVEANRDAVRDEFRRIAELGPEPLVVIAHSRGACDALAFALHEPCFVRDRVAAMFLVQAPFGGSPLADRVLGEGEPMDRRMPQVARLIGYLLGLRERALVESGRHAGLAGLTREGSRAFWRRMLLEHADALPIVSPRVYYVESQARPARLRLFQRALGHYLGTYYGPSDGMVVREDQTLPGLGTSLGTLDAGHADLTRRFPATRAGRRWRKALVQAVVMAVGRPEAPSRSTPIVGVIPAP
jgi:pimeloyl-ACP methyl ester carboxylesterase